MERALTRFPVVAARVALGSAAAVAAAGVIAVADPGQASPSARARGGVSAWLPFWTASASLRVVVRERALFSVASPFWYEAGRTKVRPYPGAGSAPFIRRLKRARLPVIPTVTSRLGPRRMAALGRNAKSRHRHVRALLRLAARHRYDGLDLDYEHMALTTKRAQAAQARAGFTALVRELCARLHRARRRCIVTVMPRTADGARVWRSKLIPGVYDYAAIARSADRIRVMAYDQHAPNTRPGPVAGLEWVDRVARYAVSKAPARKLELGIPLYGRDWGGRRVSMLTWRQAVGLQRRHRSPRRWSARTASPFFRYRLRGRRHTVWYSDAASTAIRYRLARRLGLGGIAFWAPGGEDPSTWRRLRAMARPHQANARSARALSQRSESSRPQFSAQPRKVATRSRAAGSRPRSSTWPPPRSTGPSWTR